MFREIFNTATQSTLHKIAVSGVNVINGAKIQGEGKIETSAIIAEETEVLLNINTTKDLEIAEK